MPLANLRQTVKGWLGSMKLTMREPAPRAQGEGWALALPWLLTGAALLGLAQPTLWWDEWDLAAGWLRMRSTGLDLQELWRPHNEHRIALSRLLFYGTAGLGLGTVPLMVLSYLLLGATFRLLVPLVQGACAGLPRGPRILFQLACAAFFFSWVQWENLLVGAQVAFSSALFGMQMTVRGMSDPPSLGSRCRVAGGLVLAYLSTAHWVVLIPLLLAEQGLRWWRRRLAPDRWLGLLRLAGAAAVLAAMLALYLHDFEHPPQHPSPLVALAHPEQTVGFLQLFYGNPFPTGETLLPRGMGTLFLLASCALVILAAKRRIWRTAPPLASLALATLVMVHGVALLIAIGRVGLGPALAMASRYTSFMLAGWLVLLCTAMRLILEPSGAEGPPAVRRRATVLAGLVVAVPLGLGLGASAGKLYQVATWTMPERAAGRACLEEVLADPRLLPSRRTCLQALYPNPERLYRIARQLPRR
jgi:hypothetical protein